jgi:MFS family permease
LRIRGLRQLVGVRVLSSFGDGAFQGALVSAVLFNPERQSTAAAIAAGFAVLLLPYSIIGPFAGALLDRWSRRQVIVWATLLRAALVVLVGVAIGTAAPTPVLFVAALCVTGTGRFVASGLSAALPHTVAADSLVGANALTTTSGAIATAIGGGYAIAMRDLVGDTNVPVAIVTGSVTVFYLLAATLASRFARPALGPDETDEPAGTALAVLEGFWAGFHHAVQRPTVGLAISLVVVVRFAFGLATLLILLLYQHHFTERHGILLAGLNGIAEVLAALSIGLFLGAVITPVAVRHLDRTTYIAMLMVLGAVVVLTCGPSFTLLGTMIAAPVLAFIYQASKVCADSIVQADSDDAYVGRVFALYDTANNVFYVLAFVVGAVVVADDGRSVGLLIAMAVVYLGAGTGYVLATRALRSHRARQVVARG